MAIVELADSVRLNTMFAHLLAELLFSVFYLLNDPEFLHAPYVGDERQDPGAAWKRVKCPAAAALNDYWYPTHRAGTCMAYRRRRRVSPQPHATSALLLLRTCSAGAGRGGFQCKAPPTAHTSSATDNAVSMATNPRTCVAKAMFSGIPGGAQPARAAQAHG